jgi:hypothetical protein
LTKVFDYLGTDQLVLGDRLSGEFFTQLYPRVTTPFDPTMGPVLIHEGTSIQGNLNLRVRTYLFDNAGTVVFTTNAFWNDSGQWDKDIETATATQVRSAQGVVSQGVVEAFIPGPFPDSEWNNGITLNACPSEVGFPISQPNPVGNGPPFLTLGNPQFDTTALALLPRIEADAQDGLPTLIFQSIDSSLVAGAARVYFTPFTSGGSTWQYTVNAYLDDTGAWNKDVNGRSASMFTLDDTAELIVNFQPSTMDGPWFSWNSTPYNAYTDFGSPTLATNEMLSWLKVPSVRTPFGVPINQITGSGEINLTLVDGYDTFVFVFQDDCDIFSLDMTALNIAAGDEFKIVFYNYPGGGIATISTGASAWGTNVTFENSTDPVPGGSTSTNVAKDMTIWTVKQFGTNGTSSNRNLVVSVERYKLVPPTGLV